MKRLLLASVLVSLIAGAMVQARQQDQATDTVSVLGAVRMPGIYPLRRAGHPLTLIQAIALASGFTLDAAKKKTEITRDGASEKIIVNLQDVLTGRAPDMPLQAGDVIRVPTNKR